MSLESIDHVQLAIPRGGEDVARGFYCDILGLPERPKPADMAGRGGCWFESESVKVHVGVEEPFIPARKAHAAFRVRDVAALAAKARAAGLEVVDNSEIDNVERVFIYDPFGNRLEFLKVRG